MNACIHPQSATPFGPPSDMPAFLLATEAEFAAESQLESSVTSLSSIDICDDSSMRSFGTQTRRQLQRIENRLLLVFALVGMQLTAIVASLM